MDQEAIARRFTQLTDHLHEDRSLECGSDRGRLAGSIFSIRMTGEEEIRSRRGGSIIVTELDDISQNERLGDHRTSETLAGPGRSIFAHLGVYSVSYQINTGK